MANINITIPDAVIGRVVDAIASRNGYNQATDGTKAQFAKSIVIKWIKSEVVEFETGVAAQAAANTARTTVTSEITLS